MLLLLSLAVDSEGPKLCSLGLAACKSAAAVSPCHSPGLIGKGSALIILANSICGSSALQNNGLSQWLEANPKAGANKQKGCCNVMAKGYLDVNWPIIGQQTLHNSPLKPRSSRVFRLYRSTIIQHCWTSILLVHAPPQTTLVSSVPPIS